MQLMRARPGDPLTSHFRRFTRHLATLALATLVVACGSTQGPAPGSSGGGPGGRGGVMTLPGAVTRGTGGGMNPEVARSYERQGLIASLAGVSFIGRFGFFAGPSPDSTLTLITVSLPTRALDFTRQGDIFEASYHVMTELRSAAGLQRVIDATEVVRVDDHAETQGTEESIIFQRFFNVRPGEYELSVTVRDMRGARTGTHRSDLVIPDARARGISSVVTVYEGNPRVTLGTIPDLVASPRGTAVFGRDSVLLAYVEAYGRNDNMMIGYALESESGAILYRDSVRATGTSQVSGAVVRVPVPVVGIGVARVLTWIPGRADTIAAPVFVSFGDDLPAASFELMLDYLRFFANPERISELRNAGTEQQPRLWETFLADTDPNPSTPRHEAMIEYFERIRIANERYREEIRAGWQTDRGEVYVTLGDPDQVSTQSGLDARYRNRVLVWEYQRHSLRLIFQDRTGIGRWELQTASRADFNAIARRERGRGR